MPRFGFKKKNQSFPAVFLNTSVYFFFFFGMSNMDFTNYLSGERKKQKLPVYFIPLLFTKACNTKHCTV